MRELAAFLADCVVRGLFRRAIADDLNGCLCIVLLKPAWPHGRIVNELTKELHPSTPARLDLRVFATHDEVRFEAAEAALRLGADVAGFLSKTKD